MKKKIPIGISNFKRLIEENYYFVDKSLLVKEFIENGADIILTPRPRRFGKTLNMSMIKYFFDINMKEKKNRLNGEIEYSRSLFNGLKIEKETELMKMQGEFPVIDISFNSAKFNNFKDTMSRIESLMSEIYIEHKYLLESDALENIEKEECENIINKRGDSELIATALGNLTRYLYKHFHKRVIVLLDDTIEEATKEALKQIEDKKYESELLSRGITKIKKLAIVFKNKEVKITEGI